ncbi:MAG TPA: hypothetical protein PKY14_06340, partial [Bacteroidales bacterium]|nr:hypothetical protein [Bacteroidales bacterium]
GQKLEWCMLLAVLSARRSFRLPLAACHTPHAARRSFRSPHATRRSPLAVLHFIKVSLIC